MRTLKFALTLLLVILLQSCKQPLQWNASDISGVMPNLEFALTGPEEDLTRLREAYGVYAAMESSDSKGSYNVMHSAVVFSFDAEGRARLLISDLDDGDAVVSDLKQLIEL